MSTKNKAARGKFYNPRRSPKGCDHKTAVRVEPEKAPCLTCGRADPGIWRCVDCGEVLES